jgi:hypothetical protein
MFCCVVEEPLIRGDVPRFLATVTLLRPTQPIYPAFTPTLDFRVNSARKSKNSGCNYLTKSKYCVISINFTPLANLTQQELTFLVIKRNDLPPSPRRWLPNGEVADNGAD